VYQPPALGPRTVFQMSPPLHDSQDPVSNQCGFILITQVYLAVIVVEVSQCSASAVILAMGASAFIHLESSRIHVNISLKRGGIP
jgi:hypothetical protein